MRAGKCKSCVVQSSLSILGRWPEIGLQTSFQRGLERVDQVWIIWAYAMHQWL
jgi:hypothetical protein